MWYSLKGWSVRLLAVATAAAVIFFLFLFPFSAFDQSPVLQGAKLEERAYYLYSPSSWAAEKTSLALWELPFVEGEKRVYVCDSRQDAKALAEEILREYGGYNLWTEEVDGILSYYAQSEKLDRQVRIGQKIVNLHIALDGERVAVGTPLLFGGY